MFTAVFYAQKKSGSLRLCTGAVRITFDTIYLLGNAMTNIGFQSAGMLLGVVKAARSSDGAVFTSVRLFDRFCFIVAFIRRSRCYKFLSLISNQTECFTIVWGEQRREVLVNGQSVWRRLW